MAGSVKDHTMRNVDSEGMQVDKMSGMGAQRNGVKRATRTLMSLVKRAQTENMSGQRGRNKVKF